MYVTDFSQEDHFIMDFMFVCVCRCGSCLVIPCVRSWSMWCRRKWKCRITWKDVKNSQSMNVIKLPSITTRNTALTGTSRRYEQSAWTGFLVLFHLHDLLVLCCVCDVFSLLLQYEYALRHLYALVNLCQGGYQAQR